MPPSTAVQSRARPRPRPRIMAAAPARPIPAGRSGISGRVWRSLEPPWTLPRDLEEKESQQGRGRAAGGSPRRSDYSPWGTEAGGSHSASEPSPPALRGCPACPQSQTHPRWPHPWGHPGTGRHPPHHVTLLGDSLSRAHTRRHWCTPAGDLGWGQRGTQTGCPCRRWQRANEDPDQWVSEGAKCDGQNKPVAGVRATEGPASAGGWAPTGPGTEAPLRLEPAGCGGLCERLRVASWVCIAHVCSVCARTHAREAMWHACVSTHGIVCVFLQCMSV